MGVLKPAMTGTATVRVRYFGMLRQITQKREEKFIVPDNSSLQDLVREISSKHGEKLKDLIFDSKGKLRDGFAFAADGYSIEELKLARTKCRDVREFAILPPISGG
jgi:molybdopterin converting factor small subunit